MEQANYVEVQEEIVTPDTTYMCGACYGFFQHIEDFNTHECTAASQEGNNEITEQETTQLQDTCTVVKENDLEKDVANILGGMKYSVSARTGFQQPLEGAEDQTYIINYEVEPPQDGSGISNLVEQKIQYDVETVIDDPVASVVEGVEIPSSCLFPYENPAYLNRLMKDNTVGKRVRHDAPYTHRLGPWDDICTKLLIKYVKEVPTAYFIASDNVKRTEAWELIRNKLSEADHHFTVLQIRMRWRELCKKYRNVVNYNEIHGSNRTCQFFDEMNDLFGIWDRSATELLIKELSGKNLKQNGGLRMRFNTWDKIRRVFYEHGYNYTAHQIHGRWNALVTLYQRMVARSANPDNEPLEMAYMDIVEPLLPYISSKKGKGGQGKGKEPKEKWTPQMERSLLQAYIENIENFRKSEIRNNREVWGMIVELLNRDYGFIVSVDKAKIRFYELTKYYSSMLRYNSQPGALHRECKHHEILASIYSRYNLWPHDGSVIKFDNSNTRRMRQLNAQLRWSEEESRAVLLLYPQVLTEHLQSTEQQPLEELWVEMAKMLMTVKGITKLPYEIEEHIVLLRRGFKSNNPFPFREEMEELEETEHSLCFSPEESPSTDSVQMIPYWSHSAAYLLLDYIIHYRQEGVKTLNDCMYEVISMDLESHNYKYTGKECRQYFLLLRKIFKNKVQSGVDDQREITSSFPYFNRMLDLKTVWQYGCEDTSEVRLKILEAASSHLDEIEDDDDLPRQLDLESNLARLKIHLMTNSSIHPPPSIRDIAQVLLKFMRNEEVVTSIDTNEYFGKLRSLLELHIDVLAIITERGSQRLLEKRQQEAKKRLLANNNRMRGSSVNWNDENIQVMLTTVKDWYMLCHDETEVEVIFSKGQPLWDEVAYNLSRSVKKSPSVCKDFFEMLCYNHIKEELLSYHNDPMEEEAVDLPSQSQNKELLKIILSPLVAHDAEWDPRDIYQSVDEEGWSCEETLELLFTVRELLNEENGVDWDQVRLMMLAGGFERSAERYHLKFIDLYTNYKKAHTFNKEGLIKERRRSPFYFKIHTLFGYKDVIQSCNLGNWTPHTANQEAEEDVFESLMMAFKEKKNLFCHMVPRIPLLNVLSSHLEEQYKSQSRKFPPNLIWHLLVQLHNAQADSLSSASKGPFGRDLDGLWQLHPNPLVAYGLQAIPASGWQWVKNWSVEELGILTDSFIHECLPDGFKTRESSRIPNIFLYQLGYMLSTFKHGGYEAFEKQLNLVYMMLKWSHMVLDKKAPILQRLKGNYLKIEHGKALLKSTHNGKSADKTQDEEDFLFYFSDVSDAWDSLTDSDFDSDHEATDTDEEHHINVAKSIAHKGDLNRNFRTAISPKKVTRHKRDIGQKKTTVFSPIKRSSINTKKSDVKYVFKVTTSRHTSADNEPVKSARSTKGQAVVNLREGTQGKCVEVSMVRSDSKVEKSLAVQSKFPSCKKVASKESTASNKRKNIFEEESQAKRRQCPGDSPIKMSNTAENCIIISKKFLEEQSPQKVDCMSNRITVGATDVPPKEEQTLQNADSCSQILIDGNISHAKVKNIVSLPALDKNDKNGKEMVASGKAMKNKDDSSETIEKTKNEEIVAQLDGNKEECKEALMELTNQYYERRKQEKDRLLTAFSSAQDSYQKQASALLQMFDNLQNLL